MLEYNFEVVDNFVLIFPSHALLVLIRFLKTTYYAYDTQPIVIDFVKKNILFQGYLNRYVLLTSQIDNSR